MAEKTRNLCAQIPVELHDKVRQRHDYAHHKIL